MHSFLSALETKLPPPVLVFVLAITIGFIPKQSPASIWVTALGIVLVVIGLGINVWPKRLFRKAATTVNPIYPNRASALVTAGPYRYSRNPMYVGYALALLGWVMWQGAGLGLLAVAFFLAWTTRFQIIPEERFLSERFPVEYGRYKQSVRRWL